MWEIRHVHGVCRTDMKIAFLFPHSKASDANIFIIANSECL